jgi:hypothetical protein
MGDSDYFFYFEGEGGRAADTTANGCVADRACPSPPPLNPPCRLAPHLNPPTPYSPPLPAGRSSGGRRRTTQGGRRRPSWRHRPRRCGRWGEAERLQEGVQAKGRGAGRGRGEATLRNIGLRAHRTLLSARQEVDFGCRGWVTGGLSEAGGRAGKSVGHLWPVW